MVFSIGYNEYAGKKTRRKFKKFGGTKMNKKQFTTAKLEKGEMHVYDFGDIRMHAYKTEDFLSDEVFVLEKDGKAVIIESPCFFDNNAALERYLQDLEVVGMLIAYHDAGGSFLSGIKKYTTANAKEYAERGGGKSLIDNFAIAFGDIFDKSLHNITDALQEGFVNIGGIDFEIIPTADAYNIVIPQINAVYTHMLGHDCHSIVAGEAHADAMIAELQGYIERGFDLILTSHYTPEDLKDARVKIAYLQDLKAIAKGCATAEEFKAAVKEKYPQYLADNYLDMTANMFFS